MTRSRLFLLLVILCPGILLSEIPLDYPSTRQDDVIDDYHGVKVSDPYRWLETLDGEDTVSWVNAQNSLTMEYLNATGIRKGIEGKLNAFWNYTTTDVPWREAGRMFFLSTMGMQMQPVLYSQRNLDDPPLTVFDPNKVSEDGSIAIRDFAVSPDGHLLAYLSSKGGSDASDVHVKDLRTGRILADKVSGVLTSVYWTRDSLGFFYVRRAPDDPISLQKTVLYHSLGDLQSRDRFIHEWKQNARWVYFMLSEDGRYGVIVSEQGTQTEIYAIDLIDAKKPKLNAPVFRILEGHQAFHTPIDFVGSKLYFRTNLQAERGRMMWVDLQDGASAKLHPVIAQGPHVIVDAAILTNRIVIHYLDDVKSRLMLFTLHGDSPTEIPLPGIGSVGWPLSARPSSSYLFYSFTSFLTPSSIYRFDLRKGRSTLFRSPRVPFDEKLFETKQVFYRSKDGTRVPMFITAAKNLKLDGNNPTLLTAYGGYGMTTLPEYEPDIPWWLSMGGVYAVANIRGGGEFGEGWHRAGMLDRKQNSFDDFLAAAEHLIDQRYTSRSKLAIYGHSNGGLLVGASITQRPELFAAAIANAGHYDMLRYHKFTVGSGWISEFGSPQDPAFFPHLYAYSPLHNVRKGTCYPATLLLAADHDDRVVPSHAYKFAATLQPAQHCNRPILLHVARNASHSYAPKQSDERSLMWTFLLTALNVK